MNADQLRDMILSFTNDVLLDFPDHGLIFINPWSIDRFDAGFGNITRTYTSIDDLMSDPIYDGKSLNDIASVLTAL